MAKLVLNNLARNISGKQLPPSAADIVSEVAESARSTYAKLSQLERQELELMYVAPDYGNVTLVAENVVFAKNLMVRMVSPSFIPTVQGDAVRLGYARQYPLDNLRLNRDNMLNAGLTEDGRKFQVGISIGAIAPVLASYAPNQVGGLFNVAVASPRGVKWSPYGPVNGLELAIENGVFVQVDHKDGRRVRLESIIDFDTTKPAAGDLQFGTISV
jgi:hypothetical protein